MRYIRWINVSNSNRQINALNATYNQISNMWIIVACNQNSNRWINATCNKNSNSSMELATQTPIHYIFVSFLILLQQISPAPQGDETHWLTKKEKETSAVKETMLSSISVGVILDVTGWIGQNGVELYVNQNEGLVCLLVVALTGGWPLNPQMTIIGSNNLGVGTQKG